MPAAIMGGQHQRSTFPTLFSFSRLSDKFSEKPKATVPVP